MTRRTSRAERADHTDRGLDLGLRLLDHQLVDKDDALLGNVDNAVLRDDAGQLTVTGVVIGTPGLAPRIGGRPGRWMLAGWHRLRPQAHPQPTVVSMEHVMEISATVQIDDVGAEMAADGAVLERWLRYNLISRIPGATGGPDRLSGDPVDPRNRAHRASADFEGEQPLPDEHQLSELIGASVQNATGAALGQVLDVTTKGAPPTHPVGPLLIGSLLYGRRQLGLC